MSPGAALEQGRITNVWRIITLIILRIIVIGPLLRNAILMIEKKMTHLNKMTVPRRVLTKL